MKKETLKKLRKVHVGARFSADNLRIAAERFIHMMEFFEERKYGVPKELFDAVLEAKRESFGKSDKLLSGIDTFIKKLKEIDTEIQEKGDHWTWP